MSSKISRGMIEEESPEVDARMLWNGSAVVRTCQSGDGGVGRRKANNNVSRRIRANFMSFEISWFRQDSNDLILKRLLQIVPQGKRLWHVMAHPGARVASIGAQRGGRRWVQGRARVPSSHPTLSPHCRPIHWLAPAQPSAKSPSYFA